MCADTFIGHSRVERSRSHTPVAPPFDPDDPEQVEGDLRVERQAHEALISDHGRPCYPIELGFDVFKHPGQYREILEYWEGESGAGEDTKRWVCFRQLKRWKKFLQFQQQNRRYLLFHSTFPEFLLNVIRRRRRHGLDGDVQLLEKQINQSKLDDWMEYQDYELRTYERLQKDFEEALTAGIGGGVESEDLGEMVEGATWVTLFHEEVQCAQTRFNKLQILANNAKRDFEPFNNWLESRHNEWDRGSEEGQRLIRIEVESVEFQNQNKKYDGLQKKEYEEEFACFLAGKEVEFAEEGYNAARMDDFEATVERVVLVKVIQGEARSAQIQFEEARESAEKIKLERKVINALSSIPLARGKMERHDILLVWIEQQRREIASGHVTTVQEGQTKRATSRVIRNHPTTEPSRLNKAPKVDGLKRKQLTTRSILSPFDPAKVSKAPSKRRSLRQIMSVLRGTSQAAEKTTTDSSSPESRTKQVSPIRDAMPASLRLIRASRVTKPGGKRPTELRRDGTKLPLTTGTQRRKREVNFGLSSTPSTGRKIIQQPGNAVEEHKNIKAA